MRVLFLLTQSLNDPYGIGRCWPLARQMAELGYEVEIAALHPAWSRLRSQTFVRDGVTITYAGQMHVYGEGNRRLYFSTPRLFMVAATATAALARIAIRRHVDVIHLGKAQPLNGAAGWLGTRVRKIPLYLDCDDYEAASNRFSAPWQKSVVAWWEDHLPRLASGITVNTTFMLERCIKLGVPRNKVRLIPNGYDPDRFAAVSTSEQRLIRARWGLEEHPIVLYLGSLSFASHPLTLLLDAFVHVHHRVPQALLLIVGGGEDYERVVQGIQERGLAEATVMTGRIDPAKVPDYYALSQVLVDPVFDDDVARSRNPLKVIEALAMGVPVVTGDTGDRATVLDHGRAGILVKPGSAEALAEGIVCALTDDANRNSIARQARLVSQRYRWDTLAREFVKIYED